MVSQNGKGWNAYVIPIRNQLLWQVRVLKLMISQVIKDINADKFLPKKQI
jgi:hypothetical protein